MGGSSWNQLLASLKETIEKIKAKDQNRNMLKVSIIKFASSATLYCENLNPTQVNTNVPFKSGGTNFDPPFNMAASLATKYIVNSIVVFIFMTDGGAGLPTNGIAALKKLQTTYPNKLKYAGI